MATTGCTISAAKGRTSGELWTWATGHPNRAQTTPSNPRRAAGLYGGIHLRMGGDCISRPIAAAERSGSATAGERPMIKPKTQPGGSLKPVGSETCFDCGVTLTAANRTNRDNALDANEDPGQSVTAAAMSGGKTSCAKRNSLRTLRMSHEGERARCTRIQDQADRAPPHWLNPLCSTGFSWRSSSMKPAGSALVFGEEVFSCGLEPKSSGTRCPDYIDGPVCLAKVRVALKGITLALLITLLKCSRREMLWIGRAASSHQNRHDRDCGPAFSWYCRTWRVSDCPPKTYEHN